MCGGCSPARWRLHGQNDQNSTRITPRRLERELKIMDSLWLEQKHYMKSVDAALGASFPTIERNPLYLKMNYIRHRLNNDPAMHQAYSELCRYGLRAGSKVDRFWRYSNHLPRPLFQRAVDLLLTQSVWKEMVSAPSRQAQCSMKILSVHNAYQQPGGEDQVFAQEAGCCVRMATRWSYTRPATTR